MRSTPTLIALVVLVCAPAASIAQAPAASPKQAPSAAPAKAPPALPTLPAEVESGGSAGRPAAGAPPTDEARARAKSLFERGVAAYEGARYAEALASFQEAFRLRPHPLVRVNIANCYDKLGKPLEALFHFEQFLASDVATAAQRQEVVAATERLRKHLGSVLLRVTPDGATAVLDGGEQRRTPILEPLQLPAGAHTLEVRLDGYQTVRRSFTVFGGSALELDVVLEPAASLAVSPTPAPVDGTVTTAGTPVESPTPTPALEGQRAPVAASAPSAPAADADLPTHVWVLGGLGVAMLAGATITGILALGAESDFDRYSALRRDAQAPLAQQAAHDDAIDAAERADTLALTTDVLLIGAFAGLTSAIVFAVLDDGDETVQAGASVTPDRASLLLRGRF